LFENNVLELTKEALNIHNHQDDTIDENKMFRRMSVTDDVLKRSDLSSTNSERVKKYLTTTPRIFSIRSKGFSEEQERLGSELKPNKESRKRGLSLSEETEAKGSPLDNGDTSQVRTRSQTQQDPHHIFQCLRFP
jgi:hypothetical protein